MAMLTCFLARNRFDETFLARMSNGSIVSMRPVRGEGA